MGFAAAHTGAPVKATVHPSTMTFGDAEAASPQVISEPLAAITQPSGPPAAAATAASPQNRAAQPAAKVAEALKWN
ncbi:hypothetical protein [Arthrobacter sp. SAFR-044]|uniref:hypothetical protein n=1 Tax=Arthrobacter sp. SAFR-044 TaxID=3387278 RepID=UPI003F7C447B